MANMLSPWAKAHNDVLTAEPGDDAGERAKIVAELKSRGNAAFKARRPEEALLLYSRALEHDAANHALLGNRSAVNEMLGRGKDALSDAEAAISNKPDWAKGFFRKGKALRLLKRHRESTAAFRAALNLEPSSKMLKKSVAKAEELEAKATADAAAAEERAAKQAAADAAEGKSSGGGGAAPVTIVTRDTSKAKTRTTTENVVTTDEGDLSMRGYKKTADGRTTSFFHRDIDDTAKKLIGSIAPKKIEPSAASSGAATAVAAGNSASVWNQGGTYEERNASDWAKEYLTGALLAATCAGPRAGTTCRFTKVKKVEGDASLILRKQEKRYVFDWEIEVAFQVVPDGDADGDEVLCAGTFSCADFDSEAQGACEVVAKLKAGADAESKAWAKQARGPLAGAVDAIWNAFSQEYRNRY